ncbi:MAG TPA: tetratricopeptide repeat protein, partial [Longimicrobium sp.]|nr:tetratricopeptide repeat protein [Longimicrobium sp.]
TRSLLALCLAELEQFDEALLHARRAVELEPEFSYCRWVLGVVLAERRRFKEALAQAEKAVAGSPEEPEHQALLARCHATLGHWQQAIQAADAGLEFDPDHLECANIRAFALQQRGRGADADQAFVDAASLDPGNAFARAGRGWAALQRGATPADALPHFYHALELDPHSEWARTGLLAALKARNPVYRLMLRYFLWMESLSPRTRMLAFVGGFILYNVLRRIAEANPELKPVIVPVLVLYALFILFSWTADPLFDFLLRFDPVGRTLVSAERRIAANWVVATLAAALAGLAAWVATGAERAMVGAIVAAFLTIPVAGTFQCEPGWPRTTMAAYTGLVAVAAVLAVALPRPAADTFFLVAIIGAVLGSWLSRWLASIVPAR